MPSVHVFVSVRNFPPYREERCHVKFFLGLVAQRLGKIFFALSDLIESQFDQLRFKMVYW